jgi:hypothetical protein
MDAEESELFDARGFGGVGCAWVRSAGAENGTDSPSGSSGIAIKLKENKVAKTGY